MSRPGAARPDLVGPVVLVLAGLLLLVLGWLGVRGEETVGGQLVHLNLAVGGVVLVGTGGGVHLLGLRRAVRRRRTQLAAHRRLRGVA